MNGKGSSEFEGAIDRLVRRVLLPVAGVIPVLVSSGALLLMFGAVWLGFGWALVANPAVLGECWRGIGQLPLPIQGAVWLLGMPPMAGLWAWGTDWPLVVRLVAIAGIAGWNLLVFLPRRGPSAEAPAAA